MKITNLESCLLVCLGGKKHVPCDNFKEASKAVQQYIEAKNLGSTAFYNAKNAGVILHPTKGPFANVSYNARVWQGVRKGVEKLTEITDLNTKDF